MADSNLVAYLYPTGDSPQGIQNAMMTVLMEANASRRVEAQLEDRSRHSSRAPEDGSSPHYDKEEEDGDNDFGMEPEPRRVQNNEYSPGLQFRFDDLRKNSVGIVFGQSKSADVVLPKRDSLERLAARQCALTFDGQGRLVVKDIQHRGKRGGTAVTYRGQGGQKRRQFTWILSGHRFPDDNQPIILSLHDNLQFQIVVVQHDLDSTAYQESVARFHQRVSADADDISLGGLGFQSLTDPSTASSSGAQTPSGVTVAGKDSMLLRSGTLGKGGQATVSRVWDVSTGLEYAWKEPVAKKFEKRLKTEIALLRLIDHPYIVQCVSFSMTPAPRLILEYVPLGTLSAQQEQERFSVDESLDVLCQGLLALRYLHELEEPIVHRDIKPSNILVQSRQPLHVKLSDFGLSKMTQDYLLTYCGTRLYTAPEVFSRKPYDASVDIWSLGLVVWELTHGLPELDQTRPFDGDQWTKNIVQTLRGDMQASSGYCPLLAFLAKAMLVRRAEMRSSARRCYSEASQLDASQCCGTATPEAPEEPEAPAAAYDKAAADETAHPSEYSYRFSSRPGPQSVQPHTSPSLATAAKRTTTRASNSSSHGRSKRRASAQSPVPPSAAPAYHE